MQIQFCYHACRATRHSSLASFVYLKAGGLEKIGALESGKKVVEGVKDAVVNPVYTAGHALIKAPKAVVMGTGEAILREGLLGSLTQAVEGTREALMGPGELLLGVRDGVWRTLIKEGVWDNVVNKSTLNPLNWPKVLYKFGKSAVWDMPKNIVVGAAKGVKRLGWNAPKHLVWGIPAQLLRGVSGTAESVLTGSAILLGGESDQGAAGVLIETRDALNKITSALVPKTTIVLLKGAPATTPKAAPEPKTTPAPASKEEHAPPVEPLAPAHAPAPATDHKETASEADASGHTATEVKEKKEAKPAKAHH